MQNEMKIQEAVSLKQFTTFKIGGNARYFCLVQSVEEIVQAVAFAKEKKVPFFVLGGGSNILVSDYGFDGLVIKIEIKGITYSDINDREVEVVVGAGENWDEFVQQTVEKDLFGLENLSAIPGTVGAAPVQNIGAYGTEVKACIKNVSTFNTQTGETKIFSHDECQFSYRNSFFKSEEGKKYIITHVTFVLNKNATTDISYKDLRNFFNEMKVLQPSLSEVRDAVIYIRKQKLPDLKIYGTAGSFFKNPIIPIIHYKKLLESYPGLPSYFVDEKNVKVPLAWILDTLCSYKGYKKGDIGVYQNQALVLINYKNGTADQIKDLSKEMADCVKEKTEIDIQPEVEFVG